MASGLCFPCTVRMTPDKGLGVFADADVSEGATLWRHTAGAFEVLDERSLTALLAAGSRGDAVHVLTHVVSMEEFPGFVVRHHDEGALINHDADPNVRRKSNAGRYPPFAGESAADVARALLHPCFDLVAARAIAAGDELLMDYNDEPDDPPFVEEACRRFGVDWDWLQPQI
ncbi:MAG: SET domain-containing protein-lysine N-methyltransferase [Pseudomonadota bacterium]